MINIFRCRCSCFRWFVLLTACSGILIGYLMFWPVLIEPVRWNAPVNQGYLGDFAPNDTLQRLSFIELGGEYGPEDVAVSAEGVLYVPVHSGKILKVEFQGGLNTHGIGKPVVTEFANTGGRVLGVEIGSNGVLYAADAFLGLFRIDTQGDKRGDVQLLSNIVSDGSPIRYANDLDITDDGIIYFTDASTKFGAKETGSTLDASLLDIAEHGGHGRVLKYDPQTKLTSVVIDGKNFANGLAMANDGSFLLIAETGSYRVLKYWLKGDKIGQTEVLLSNLPGFPDNINANDDGSFWMGLVSPRSDALDKMAAIPFLRKVMMRLPRFVRPKPQRYGFAVRFDEAGKIIETVQDPDGHYAMVTGAIDLGHGHSAITSLTEPRIGILIKQ